MANIIDMFKLMRSLSHGEKENLAMLAQFTSKSELNTVRKLLKQKRVNLSISFLGLLKKDCPHLTANDSAVEGFVEKINSEVRRIVKKGLVKEFSDSAFERIQDFIAPNIVGMEAVKKAAVLQLFAPDHVHLLLLGDPGTGKTDVLRSVNKLSPVSSFGLGSGTTGVGLAVTIKGKEVNKGLLPMADNGICCIDELNLMKEDNRASLYNAMEKGFITYDKGGHHHRFDARISVIATANPKGDKFSGKTVESLKKQLPFDPALLSRFHMVFVIRKPTAEQFKEISKSIVKGKKIKLSEADIEFLKEYIQTAFDVGEIKIPSSIEREIVNFTAKLKKDEDEYLVEISPRIVIGITRLCKASARLELRNEVQQKDIDRVEEIMRESLEIV
jgi:DNA replicative helicase MCM subunit Mcm2 (Cdc46/Mcm family)